MTVPVKLQFLDYVGVGDPPKLKFADMFCGVGGFHQALVSMGFECVVASDIDKECRIVYEENYGITPEGDINELDIQKIPYFDILCGGFPCQPFSKAGKQKGFSDSRGNLFFRLCEIIDHHRPKYLLLENVRNLVTHDKGNTWEVMKKQIDELGYFTYPKPMIVNALNLGVPQFRERAIIMCKRKDLGKLPSFPTPPKRPKTSLKDVIDAGTKGYDISPKLKVAEKVWDSFLELLYTHNVQIPKFPIWTNWWDSDGNDTSVTKHDIRLSKEENMKLVEKRQKTFYTKYKSVVDRNRTFYREHRKFLQPWLASSRKEPLWVGAVRKFEWQAGETKLTMKDVLWSARGSGIRVKNLDYAPTLVAMTSMIPVYGPESRHLSPRECMRLQSFSEDFKPHEKDRFAYKHAGNAVNATMIERCANFLIYGNDIYA